MLKLLMASDAVTGKVRDVGIERGAAKGSGQGAALGRGLVGAAVKRARRGGRASVGPPSLEKGAEEGGGALRLPRMLHGEARGARVRPDDGARLSCLRAVKGAYAAEPLMEVVALENESRY